MPRLLRLLTPIVILTALVSVPLRVSYAAPAGCKVSAETEAGQQAAITVLVNKARAAAGLGALTINPKLTAAAARHTKDMAAKDFLDHTGSDQSTMEDRFAAAGYNYASARENILYRWDLSAAEAYNQWWNSPGHKANMMADDVTEIGIVALCSMSSGKYYYTMVLGKPLDASSGGDGAAPANQPDQGAQPDGIVQQEE